MPNMTRRLMKVELTFTLQGVEHLYRYYLRGFSRAIVGPAEMEKSAHMLAGLEDVLVRSGYLTELEIKKIHAEAGMPGETGHAA